MKMRVLAIAIIVLFIGSAPAFAHHRHHSVVHHHYSRHRPKFLHGVDTTLNFAMGLGFGLGHMLNSMQPHPAGCPRTAFCGCGTSVRVFGHPVRDLYLAANWYRFPRGAAIPGNVIVRPHHVKYIENVENGILMCYDPNSGHHLTRIQPCGSGGTIVNPRG